jgi:hypothetical protein
MTLCRVLQSATLREPMAVLTPDSEASELHARAAHMVRDGSTPDEVCACLPVHGGGAESDAALWLYSWALAQQRDERPLPRIALPPVGQ